MKKTVEIVSKIFLIFALIASGGGIYYLHTRVSKLEQTGAVETQTVSEKLADADESASEDESKESLCGSECEKKIDEKVAAAVATISSQTKTVYQTAPSSSATTQTAYVPMGTTYTTTSMTWVDVPDSGIYVDLSNDYSKSAQVSWETSLKVAHGNGKAYVRLWDDTNKIAVDYSELTTEDNVDYQQVTSKYLPFWQGRNLYKVQLKSLNSFEVTYSGGKLKIVY